MGYNSDARVAANISPTDMGPPQSSRYGSSSIPGLGHLRTDSSSSWTDTVDPFVDSSFPTGPRTVPLSPMDPPRPIDPRGGSGMGRMPIGGSRDVAEMGRMSSPVMDDSRVSATSTTGMERMSVENVNYPTNQYQTQATPMTTHGTSTPGTAIIQAGCLETWSFYEPLAERVQVLLKTEGRSLQSNIQLWEGPESTPYKLDVYLEDGDFRDFNAVIDIPGDSNSISVRNTGQLELESFPISASIEIDNSRPKEMGEGGVVEGGAVDTFPFEPTDEFVQVLLKTDGCPLRARIELVQGSNNNKQVMEIFSQDGMARPFRVVLENPGVDSFVRIVNNATVDFPLNASVEPLQLEHVAQPKKQKGKKSRGTTIYDPGFPDQ